LTIFDKNFSGLLLSPWEVHYNFNINRQNIPAQERGATLPKREILKRVCDIIRCLERQQTLPTETTCSMVATKKLELLVKEAPASLVYDLSCIHSQLLHSGEDVTPVLNQLKQLLHSKGR